MKVLAILSAVLSPLACIDARLESAPERAARATTTECQSQVIPWGAEAAALGFAPAANERAARGPLAVAIDRTDGTSVVLDNQKSRVVSVDRDGVTRTRATVDHTAEELAIAADGALAIYSPLRARVEVFSKQGTPVGSVAVPRQLRHVSRIALGKSLQVYAYSALQERHSLGSPSAPLAFGTILRSNVEGAWRPNARSAVVSVVKGGSAELRVLDAAPDGSRPGLDRVLVVPGNPVDALQIVAGSGSVVCARGETLSRGTPEVNVQRRLLCVDLETDSWLVDFDLGAPGPYLPRREIAVSATDDVVTTLHSLAGHDGLELRRCEVPR